MLEGPGNSARVVYDGPNQAHRTPCARMSPEDIFVSACAAVGPYFRDYWDTRKQIRCTCRHGRQLHDRMRTSLTLDLSKTTKVPYADIRTTLSGMVQRGARFQTAEVKFNTKGSHSRQRKQLQAALPAFGGPHLTILELRGMYCINPYIAAKLATSCPSVTSLTLDSLAQGVVEDEPSSEEDEDDAGEGPATRPPASLTLSDVPCEGEALAQGRIHLLQEMGPRLTELTLLEAEGWWTASLQALRHCRALTDLYFDAGENDPVDLKHQADILESISQLPQLQSLHLNISCRAPQQPRADIPTCDICSYSHLSALTSLTYLHLENHPGNLPAGQELMWDQLWPTQREALVAALRHLPHLTNFSCASRTLSVSDLAVLTSLTRVYVKGLTPPGPAEQQQLAASGPGTAVMGPPQLRKLIVATNSCSLRAVVCFGSFPHLREFMIGMSPDCLCFGAADVAPGGSQLLPDTRHMVQQAVRAVADVRARAGVNGGGRSPDAEPRGLRITTDLDDLLLPPAPAPFPASPAGGHAAWLRELGPLAVPGQEVELWGLALAAGDLVAIADTFPEAKSLSFWSSRVQLAALPCLGRMRQLQQLTVDLRRGGMESKEVLSAALFATCQCCTQLQVVEVVCDHPPALQDLCGEVQRALEHSGRGQVEVELCWG